MTDNPESNAHVVTVLIPKGLPQDAHIVTLSNRLAFVWTSSQDFSVIFDGEVIERVLRVTMKADAERGLRWGIKLTVSSTDYEPPPEFFAELARCGFAVRTKDLRYDDT